MPLPVPPSPSGLGTPVTSTDGYLTCRTDAATASVRIVVNFTGVAGGTPDRVTVQRTVSGVVSNVRGMDNLTSPGAVDAGLDHWAPLGATCTYQAFATNSVTGASWQSTPVTLAAPAAAARKGWVKSTRRPALSVALSVLSWPDWSYDVPQGVFYPIGARFPVVVESTRQSGTGQVTFGTLGVAELQALQALLAEGGPLLLQSEAVHGALRPDVYVAAGGLQQAAPIQQAPWRRWTLAVTEVAPPPTRVLIPVPGHTFADSAVRWPLLSDRTGAFLDRLIT